MALMLIVVKYCVHIGELTRAGYVKRAKKVETEIIQRDFDIGEKILCVVHKQ